MAVMSCAIPTSRTLPVLGISYLRTVHVHVWHTCTVYRYMCTFRGRLMMSSSPGPRAFGSSFILGRWNSMQRARYYEKPVKATNIPALETATSMRWRECERSAELL